MKGPNMTKDVTDPVELSRRKLLDCMTRHELDRLVFKSSGYNPSTATLEQLQDWIVKNWSTTFCGHEILAHVRALVDLAQD
jgi:hypothetical protein